MRHNKIFLVSTLLLLAACRDPGQAAQDNASPAVDPAVTTTPDVAPAEVAKAPVERKVAFVSPIAGSIAAFPFAYHVSVDREVTRKGTDQKSREVGVEFLDTNVVDADKAVAAEFEKAGFKQASSEKQGRALRSVYTKQGHGDVLVWVRPGAPRGERYVLQMPEAKGTVYLAYPLSN